MKYKSIFVMFLMVTFFLFAIAQLKDPDNSKKAIICLTYDDGLESQLTTAIPQLDSAGLKATFFLNSVDGSPPPVIGKGSYELVKWKKAAAEGHELGNHTLFHPCPEKLGWQKEIAIDGYSISKMVNEVKACSEMLSLIDGKSSHPVFAYPCNNTVIHDTDYSEILKQSAFINYARAGGDENSIITDFSKLNRLKVPSYFVQEGTTAAELIQFAEKVKQSGGLGIYQFHGIGSQIFAISTETHRQFLDYLRQKQSEIRVAIFSEAMGLVTKK